ncbi:HAD hydrolase family protein [Paenibacillus massiliensis]|uniref:HAD hydrolase family protein n=1 Tax=Paenibacillus massiliensis TaxID=225917 RepID=UPI0012B6393B
MPSSIIELQKALAIDSPIICYSGALVLGKDSNHGQRSIIDSTNLSQEAVKGIMTVVDTLAFIEENHDIHKCMCMGEP